jgi:arginyl-tRNA synthetase
MANLVLFFRNIIIDGLILMFPDKTQHLSSKRYDFIIEIPPEKLKSNADLSTNIAMVFAKIIGKSSVELSQDVCKILTLSNTITQAEVAGAGFVNFTINYQIIIDFMQSALQNNNYGIENIGQGEQVNIEYVSANPTGPMHIGHTRGAIYGNILCNLLTKTGYDITQEYYINDAGSQINTLVKSVYIRYLQIANPSQNAKIEEGCYPGEYLIPVAQKIFNQYSTTFVKDNFVDFDKNLRQFIINEMMALITADLKRLGIQHDVFTSEQQITNGSDMIDAFRILKDKHLIYRGTIEKPKDASEDWEEVEQDLFRSTQFGDDMDRPIKKSDGSWAYFAPDIALHYNKYKRGFNKMILILGSDHKGYAKRISAAVNAISNGKATIDVKLYEIVNFMNNGQPVKMSKRSGNFLTAADVVDEIDPSILRFTMLTRKPDTILAFDFAKAKEQSKENPVFYVQYAYSRCCSILQKATPIIGNSVLDYSLLPLQNKHLRQLVIKIANFPHIVSLASRNHEPHLIAFYLVDLASHFHTLWNDGDIKFINESNPVQTATLCSIVQLTKKTIATALDIFGVTPVEKM